MRSVDDLLTSFRYGYDSYIPSRAESDEIWNLYNGRQLDMKTKLTLTRRGQPQEYHNVIRKYTRMLIGYFATTVNTVTVRGLRQIDAPIAALVTDIVDHIFSENRIQKTEGNKFKKSMILDGLACMEIYPMKTKEKDEFGRPIFRVQMTHVPNNEIILDPMSEKADYTDARFIHRFKWMSEDQVKQLFGDDVIGKLKDTSENNYLGVREADYTYKHYTQHRQDYSKHRVYQIIHSVVREPGDRYFSIYWSGRHKIMEKEITNRLFKFPYVVHKLEDTDKVEYYGIFRDVKETQKSINQAVLKLQLMANSQMIFVDENGLGEQSLKKFADQVNRVNAVIKVQSLAGVKVENMNVKALEQYAIIDKALDRIQEILHINDSFLGQAAASDSGRKVKLQQGSTIIGLNYIQDPIEEAWRIFGEAVVSYIQQYYTAHQAFQISDSIYDERFVELNQPIVNPQTGAPVYEIVEDPDTGLPMEDDKGDIIVSPMPRFNTEPANKKLKVQIEASSFEDEDERSQFIVESFVNGPAGQYLPNILPVQYLKMLSVVIGNMKTKAALPLKRIIDESIMMLSAPEDEAAAAYIAGESTSAKDGKSRKSRIPSPNKENVTHA